MGPDEGEGGVVKMTKHATRNQGTLRSILFISPLDLWSMGKGKGGPALYKTLTGYANRGWKVYFITGLQDEELLEDLHENITVIRFNDAPWLKRIIQSVKKIGFLARIVWWLYFQIRVFIEAQKLRSNTKIDIVYGYEIFGVPVAKMLSKLWGVPMVARFQGTPLGVFWQKKRFGFLRAWEDVIAMRIPADLVIMTNDGTQGDRVLQQLGVDMRKVRFWLNGVDRELFNLPFKKDEAKSILGLGARHILLCVSRLANWKRVDRSIRALPSILEEYPDTILVIVGDGPERGRLEQLAVKLGVREHVRFEGAVPHSEVPKYLAAADVFLSLNDWSNVGNPLLEAMIAGKCIVTLNNGDTGQFIKNGENGVLLDYEDLARLPELIKELLANEELRNRFGTNARKFAEKHFWSWEERIEAEVQEVNALLEHYFKEWPSR